MFYNGFTTQSTPSPRKRGGQPGNRNAFKHGFYASRPPAAGLAASAPPGRLHPELGLYRLILERVLGSVSAPPEECNYDDELALFHVACMSIARLNGFWGANFRLNAADTRSLFVSLRSLGFTEEELRAEGFIREKFSPNAFKVGLYTRHLLAVSHISIDPAASLEDEITLLHVLLLRLSRSFEAHRPADPRQLLYSLDLFNCALEVVCKLRAARHLASALPPGSPLEQAFARFARLLVRSAPPSGE